MNEPGNKSRAEAMDKFNVLFTSSGRRVSLIRAFRKSFQREKIKSKLIGADFSRLAPTSQVVDKFYNVPRVDSMDYIPSLLEICKKEKIDLLVPLIDTELMALAQSRDSFKKTGAFAMISSPETIEIAMDKMKTSEFFLSRECKAVRTFCLKDIRWKEELVFPFILKPAKGSASIGVHKVNNEMELEILARNIKEPLVQEQIQGKEYTTDVLIDLNGKGQAAIPRLRIEVRAGEVSKGMTVRNKKLIDFIIDSAEALPGARGVINIQAFEDEDGEFCISEVNPRFGGGFPLSYQAGADFPFWLYLMLKGKLFKAKLDSWNEGIVMLRYDDELIFKADPKLFNKIISKSVK